MDQEQPPVDITYRVSDPEARPLTSWQQASELVRTHAMVEFVSTGDRTGFRPVAWSSTSEAGAYLSLGVIRAGRATTTVSDHGDGTVESLVKELKAFLTPLDQIKGLESTLHLSLVIAPDQERTGELFPLLSDAIFDYFSRTDPAPATDAHGSHS